MRIGHVDQPVSHEWRGYGYIAFRFQTPKFPAGFEIVACNVRIAVGHNLGAVAGLENTGCGPTADRERGPRHAPELASIRRRECREKAVFLAIGLNNDGIFEERGRARKAPRESPVIGWRHIERTQVFLPLQ